MKIWLDDIRTPPNGFIWVKTAKEAIEVISINIQNLEEISFDHDLGEPDCGTGYEVAKYIEKMSYFGAIKDITWHIHSSNPVGRKNIMQAMCNAERYWNQ